MIKQWIIKRNDERYPSLACSMHPREVIVWGKREEAEFVAMVLCDWFPGCEHFYYIDEEEE